MADLNEIQGILANLSQDIEKMSEITAGQLDIFMGALDDVAAHTLAVQAIMINVMKQITVDPDEVEAWIDENTKGVGDDSGEGAAKSKALARYLITGKAED